MKHIGLILCAVSLPATALAYETANKEVETVIEQSGALLVEDQTVETVVADCSGNTITIVNTGKRVAVGGGNAAGVTINGNSITVDGKTTKCGIDK